MKLKNYFLRRFIRDAVIAGVASIAFFSGLNLCTHHNISNNRGYAKIYEKIDGVFSYTRFEKYPNNYLDGKIELIKNSGFPLNKKTRYSDYNKDGLVDRIWRTPTTRNYHPLGIEIYRDPTNIELFEKADELFAKEKERFKKIMIQE